MLEIESHPLPETSVKYRLQNRSNDPFNVYRQGGINENLSLWEVSTRHQNLSLSLSALFSQANFLVSPQSIDQSNQLN